MAWPLASQVNGNLNEDIRQVFFAAVVAGRRGGCARIASWYTVLPPEMDELVSASHVCRQKKLC